VFACPQQRCLISKYVLLCLGFVRCSVYLALNFYTPSAGKYKRKSQAGKTWLFLAHSTKNLQTKNSEEILAFCHWEIPQLHASLCFDAATHPCFPFFSGRWYFINLFSTLQNMMLSWNFENWLPYDTKLYFRMPETTNRPFDSFLSQNI
jgi:hypothetical protein